MPQWRSILIASAAAGLIVAAAAQPAPLTPARAEAIARALLSPGQAAAVQAHATSQDVFVLRESGPIQADERGAYHLHFDRLHQSVPVEGGDIIVHIMPDGSLFRVTTMLTAPLQISTVTPGVTRAAVEQKALERFRRSGQGGSAQAELVISAVAGLDATPKLAWLVKVRGTRCRQPSWMHYLFDAASGALIRQHEAQESLVPIVCPEPPEPKPAR